MIRERHLEEPEVLATGEEEQSEDEVTLIYLIVICKTFAEFIF